jgi:hypothetical protein
MTTAHPRTVFDWLDHIRARPSMYIGRGSLRELSWMVNGYYAALTMNGIVEDVPAMHPHFDDWLHWRTGWPSLACGWAHAIASRHPGDAALPAFFQFVDEYRRLRPCRVATVELGPDHQPTGKRVRIGSEGRIERPCRVDIVCYVPEPLHFLRFHYGQRVQNQHLLQTASRGYVTGVEDAKRWVLDELQVDVALWERGDEPPAS